MPPLFTVPDPFRKFPGANTDTAPASMDFGDELASLINSPSAHHQSSHERSTQSPSNAYDDYRPHTHNIFDISAPTHHHHHSHSASQQHQSPHSPFGGPASFSLPPANALHPSGTHSSMHNAHPLHDFTSHSHFNSTVPAIGSSMRYEPPPSTPSTTVPSSGFPGAEPSSVSSFSSHISNLSNMSSFSNLTTTSEFHLPQPQRHTPSPPGAAPQEFSRSRSRSRAGTAATVQPPSTNGGPARRTRAKRNSVSSVSPPPLHRGHTQPLVIPNGTTGGRGPVSPLSLHTNGWFIPGAGQQGSEFSLPTPESVHGGFSAFTGGTSVGSVGLGVSPKEVSVPGMGIVSAMQKNGETPPEDMAAKQAQIANEKRRRRRESHNAVERRRRDNINEKISELATLIPECLLDPNATLTMPPSLSVSGEDLLFGMTTTTTSPSDRKEGSGSAEPEDKDGGSATGADSAGVVKANKGMILRKSVEYIRYLQQLVSAQATRNRDLEQQLHAFRGEPNGAGAIVADGEEMGGLVLHEEVGDAFALMGGIGAHHAHGGLRKGFHGFELESVEEMDQDHDESVRERDPDHDMERPSTAGTGARRTRARVPGAWRTRTSARRRSRCAGARGVMGGPWGARKARSARAALRFRCIPDGVADKMPARLLLSPSSPAYRLAT
ncbi:hypothetical protein A0H81_02636 [Grifola frondosa]|uniref:BHLH domain-containing protein n=1 Tax=Grifola frondosa TaxID=5627 RepID=A0A1C7MNW3_GRIFR|nr:hypothetical protein A0H81_02636 [Grifola frondosa]